MNAEQAIEMIQCAKINVDNLKKVGPLLIPLIQLQLDQALTAIDPIEFPAKES